MASRRVAITLDRSWIVSLGTILASGLIAPACWTYQARPVRFALTIGARLAGERTHGRGSTVACCFRNGTSSACSRLPRILQSQSHRLFHGQILHGQQSLDPARRRAPSAITTGAGRSERSSKPSTPGPETWRPPLNVAVVGLGWGSLAAYAEPGERLDVLRD